jgi:hypothetical protein
MAFNAARRYGEFMIVAVAAALLSTPFVGCWPLLAVAIAGYFVLVFFNRLEERDLCDEKRRRPSKRQ